MKNRMRSRYAIVYIIFGAVLLGCQVCGLVDEFWGGLGSAFFFMGVLTLFRAIKYKTNENYRENVDTAAKDERNRFLTMKAWSWAGYLFVLIAAVCTLGFRIAGMNDISFAASMCVCIIITLYWLCYMVLKRKY